MTYINWLGVIIFFIGLIMVISGAIWAVSTSGTVTTTTKSNINPNSTVVKTEKSTVSPWSWVLLIFGLIFIVVGVCLFFIYRKD